jgi:crotonobetainyl-CoA:carnitine CoA-transferase CaiB-like acyl-CoA transferase
MQCQELSLFLNGGHFGPRENEELAHPLEPPPYGIYEASDGKYLAISSGPWPTFCGAIGMEDLETDQRFDSPKKRRLNKSDLFQIVAFRIKKNTASYWLNLFEKRGVWSAPVYDYHEVSQDVQVKANDMIITQNYADIGEFKTVGNPIKLSATPASYRMPPPVLSQDTDAILRDLEFSQDDIEQFKKDGVV